MSRDDELRADLNSKICNHGIKINELIVLAESLNNRLINIEGTRLVDIETRLDLAGL